jgi:hypothetical protein
MILLLSAMIDAERRRTIRLINLSTLETPTDPPDLESA